MVADRWLYICLLLLSISLLACRLNAEPSAIIVFGDSTVDTGTNYYLDYTPFNFQANRYPYGFKAFSGQPTGRFTEGRIVIDYIAEYTGFPLIEPYLKPGVDFSRGVNFASGGAAALRGINEGLVLDLRKQLSNFLDFCRSMEKNPVEYESFISNAVYLISIGSNDYLSGYLSRPDLHEVLTPEKFATSVVSEITEAIELLHSKGARKVVVFGVGPLGCIPPLRIFNGTGGCLDSASALGQVHNYALTSAIGTLRQAYPDTIILRTDFYDFFLDRQNNFESYGFKEPFQACCGVGPFRGRGHCGIKTESLETNYELCEEPSAHIWWDPYHPSERVHQQFAEALWAGKGTSIEPMSLKQLFGMPTTPSSMDESRAEL